MSAPDEREVIAVKRECDGLRLRIFTHEAVRYWNKPMHAALVERARAEGIAGATVFRGIEGYGVHRHIHTNRLVDASDELPVVVELVDREEAIRRFLPLLDEMLPHGAVTVSPAHIITYSRDEQR
jgi:PII-like signaling protein